MFLTMCFFSSFQAQIRAGVFNVSRSRSKVEKEDSGIEDEEVSPTTSENERELNQGATRLVSSLGRILLICLLSSRRV